MARKQTGILISEKNAEASRQVFAINMVVQDRNVFTLGTGLRARPMRVW